MGYQGRDVEVVPIHHDQYLVAACDSCGAVGFKELDLIRVSPYIVGRLTARVALLEVVTTGSRPQLATIAVCNEPDPSGVAILQGVRAELAAFELADLPLAISTEKNFPTRQTGLGISVVGLCTGADLRIAITRPGDLLYCLGLPKVGPEIDGPDDPEIVQYRHVQRLLLHPAVHDLIPVGSQGIAGEVELLAANINGRPRLNPAGGIDLTKSAGPSTCLIFSAAAPFHDPLLEPVPLLPIGVIGPKP